MQCKPRQSYGDGGNIHDPLNILCCYFLLMSKSVQPQSLFKGDLCIVSPVKETLIITRLISFMGKGGLLL